MKDYFKSELKHIPMMLLLIVLFYGTTALADNYLFNSNEVEYDNSTSNISSSNVQGAIDELYTSANNFATYNTRLQGIEDTIGSGTLNTTSQNLIGAVNGLNDHLAIFGHGQASANGANKYCIAGSIAPSGIDGVPAGSYAVSVTLTNDRAKVDNIYVDKGTGAFTVVIKTTEILSSGTTFSFDYVVFK